MIKCQSWQYPWRARPACLLDKPEACSPTAMGVRAATPRPQSPSGLFPDCCFLRWGLAMRMDWSTSQGPDGEWIPASTDQSYSSTETLFLRVTRMLPHCTPPFRAKCTEVRKANKELTVEWRFQLIRQVNPLIHPLSSRGCVRRPISGPRKTNWFRAFTRVENQFTEQTEWGET